MVLLWKRVANIAASLASKGSARPPRLGHTDIVEALRKITGVVAREAKSRNDDDLKVIGAYCDPRITARLLRPKDPRGATGYLASLPVVGNRCTEQGDTHVGYGAK